MRQFADYGRYPATIAGHALSNPAWMCVNPEDLLLYAPQRRSNIVLPRTHGRLPRAMWDDERTVDLRFEMFGDCDPLGDPHDDPESGLAINKRLFAAMYFRAGLDAFGQTEATIEDLDGLEFTGNVQVDAPLWGVGLTECSATMSVTIPRGELIAELGS